MIDLADFAKCVTCDFSNGHWMVDCKRGLWSVSAATKHDAIKEGLHYWQQYYYDGEYDNLLGRKNNKVPR